MKKIFVIINLLFISTVIFAKDCAQFNLDQDQLVIELPVKDQFIKVMKDNIVVNNFYCIMQRNEIFDCSGDDDSGHFEIRDQNVRVFQLHIGNPDEKMYHYDGSKASEKLKFIKIACP